MTNQEFKSRNIAVTGGGFKAKQILQMLDQDHHFNKVISLDFKPSKVQLERTKFYKLDLTENLADIHLAEILKKENIDTLIHTAFPITPPRNLSLAHEIISVGSMYICNAAAAANIKKLMVTTTTDIYGAFADNPNYLTEEHPIRAFRLSSFLKDKCDAEKEFLRFSKKHPETIVTILRPCTIMGPHVDSFKTKYFNLPIIPTILGYDPLMQFIHEDDFIESVRLSLNKNCSGIYNIVGQGVLPLSKIIALSGKFTIPCSFIVLKALVQPLWYLDLLPAPASYINYLKYLCVAAGDKAEQELGFKAKYTTKDAFLSFVGAERLRSVHLVEAASHE